MWVKPVSVNNVNFPILLNKGTVNNSYLMFVGETALDGHPAFRVVATGGSLDAAFEGRALDVNVWSHLVGTWDGTTIRLYRNGVQVAQKAFSGAGLQTDTGVLSLGNSSSGGGNQYQGTLDDVRIFNRALTPAEVLRMYKIGLASKTNRAQGGDQFDKGLVGHWTFDGKDISGTRAKDRSGNNNHGTMTLGPTQTPGKVGQALNFDGVDDYVTVPDNASLRQASNFSYGAWTNLQSVAATAYSVISKWNAAGSRNYYLGKSTSSCSGTMCCTIDNVSANANITLSLVENSGWHHLFCVADASAGKLYAYLDGRLISSDTYDGTSETGTSTLNIGNSANGIGTAQAQGGIDDARVYSRALSAGEIKRLYDITQPKINATKNSLDNGLVGHWTFDGRDVSGTRIKDRSGMEIHGTNNNGVALKTGRIGQGLSFDGSNQYITTNSNAAIDFTNEVYSYSMWIKPAILVDQYIIAKRVQTTGWGTYIQSTGGVRNVQEGDSSVIASMPAGSIKAGMWQHIVLTSNGSVTKTYLNGVLMGTGGVNNIQDTSFGIRLGQDENGGAKYTGNMDDVRIYNRALSAGEVNKLYQMGR